MSYDIQWQYISRLPSGVINSKKMCKAIGNMPDILLNLRIKMWGFPTFFVAGIILGGKQSKIGYSLSTFTLHSEQ